MLQNWAGWEPREPTYTEVRLGSHKLTGPDATEFFTSELRKQYWTCEEAASYLLGVIPAVFYVDDLAARIYGDFRRFARYEYLELLELLQRRFESARVSPRELLDWAREVGVSIPPELAALLPSTTSCPSEASSSRSTRESDVKRRLNSLYKIALGVAMDKFRYNPVASKNHAPKAISDALDRQGIELSEDTIRNVLREAVDQIGGDLNFEKDFHERG